MTDHRVIDRASAGFAMVRANELVASDRLTAARRTLERLRTDPDASLQQISDAYGELHSATLDSPIVYVPAEIATPEHDAAILAMADAARAELDDAPETVTEETELVTVWKPSQLPAGWQIWVALASVAIVMVGIGYLLIGA